MDYFNLIIGILSIIGCGIYIYYLIIKELNREEDTDYMDMSYNIEIVFGIVMVYREMSTFL